ncbi:Slc12a4, partial [Symbiodinium microadriaticum]
WTSNDHSDRFDVRIVNSCNISIALGHCKIMAGGPYYVISRNLGVEVGAAIGFIFYLGTTLAASMYILGAIEAIQTGFGLADQFTFDSQLESIILSVLLAAIVSVGVKYVNMSASFFLLVVFVSIFSAILGCFLYLGGEWRGDVDN